MREREREKWAGRLFEEIMAKNFPESEGGNGHPNSRKMNPKNPTPRHIIVKLSKVKEKNLEGNMRKVTWHVQRSTHEIASEFLGRILQAGRQWDNIFKVLKEKNICQIRILCPAKLSFKYGEIKIFPDKQNLRYIFTTRPALQEILKGVLQFEIRGCQRAAAATKTYKNL